MVPSKDKIMSSKDKIGGSRDKIKKDHARSNSTLSKKSVRDPKSCFKIDLSKLAGQSEA